MLVQMPKSKRLPLLRSSLFVKNIEEEGMLQRFGEIYAENYLKREKKYIRSIIQMNPEHFIRKLGF